MGIKEIIHRAGNNLHTVIITTRGKNGSIEAREVVPYSYRITAGSEKIFCYDINKEGVRNFLVSDVISVEETQNSFQPRWEVEI